MEKSTLSEGIFCHLRTDDKRFYYMTSDNVFSDWLTPLVTLFDKTLQSPRKKSREVSCNFDNYHHMSHCKCLKYVYNGSWLILY
jgi:hypothetical protein